MRGHIVGLPKLLILLAIAVMMTPVTFMAWSFAGFPQPGEAIPDSIAATLRGGGCSSGLNGPFPCTNSNTKCTLSDGTTTQCEAQAAVYDFPGQGIYGGKGAEYCCGADTSCNFYREDKTDCGKGG